LLLAVASLLAGGCSTAPTRGNTSDFTAPIGSATMAADGTITLDLMARGDRGQVGEARFVYRPGDKDYQSILDHVGPLKPGESKPVRPWPRSQS
jgi:hypothetical protein